MTNALEFIIHEPRDPAVGSIIWLHGLGANGHDFSPIALQLNLPRDLHLRFLFPHAPIRAVTINDHRQMRAWFDVYDLEKALKEDETGIQQSQQLITDLITAEINKGIPSDKIILAGFSQGGAMSLYTGLCGPQKLGGIIALSCYLPLRNTIEHAFHPANANLPIFIAHGTYDPVLPVTFGHLVSEKLRQLHYPVEWHEYPIAHTVCPPELHDIGHWITQRYVTNTTHASKQTPP